MEVLNKRFGLRRLLRNTTYHASDKSIPKTELTEEKEPELHRVATQLATELAANPDAILIDTYPLAERVRDWKSLVKKDAVTFDSRSRLGHKLLDHHMPHFWDVTNSEGVSVRSTMTVDALRKAILLNTQMHSTPYKSEIRRTLVLSAQLASVTKYRAGLSKYLTKRYSAKAVLDPCIGWGGRMIGVLAGDAEYIGCEPDPNTFQGLQGILADIEKIADISNTTAEARIPTLPDECVDMILTSPPYYTLEMYTAGDQSVKPTMSWETWVTTWLRPIIHECLRCLRPDGKSCWSVKNFKIKSRVYPLADVVRDIHLENGFVMLESFTMKGPGRPGVTKPSEEQTFVYRRVGA
jgi:hypothetical protein